jgi:hypothetical protein
VAGAFCCPRIQPSSEANLINDRDDPLGFKWPGRFPYHSFHLVRRLIIRGSILPRPTHPVWRDALLLLLSLIRSVTFRFSSLECVYVLYFTLVKSKLECTSVVWNAITSTDDKKLEHFQRKFPSACFYRFPPCILNSCTFAWEKLSLPSYGKEDITLIYFFRSIVALNPAFPFRKMLAFVFLPAILGTSHCLVFAPLINTVLLLGASMLPMRWAKIPTYL